MHKVILLLTAGLPFIFAAMAVLFYHDFVAPRRRKVVRRSDRRDRRRRDRIRYRVWKDLWSNRRLPRLIDQRGVKRDNLN